MTLAHLRRNPGLEITEAELEDVADGVMMEDVIRRQKLEAEIREGEKAVEGFTVTEVSEAGDNSKSTAKCQVSPICTNMPQTFKMSHELSGYLTLTMMCFVLEDFFWLRQEPKE